MIAWFARNHVAANLLMIAIVAGGLYSIFNRITLEVFPSTDLDVIAISVPFPGATPTESEEGVAVRLEEAVQDLHGIDELTSTSSEGLATVRIDVLKGFDARDLLNDVKNRVDSLSTLPEDAETPQIALAQFKREVISVALYGDTDEKTLRETAEQVRDELLSRDAITQIELEAVRPYELAIEISENDLRQYGLTLEQVAAQIGRNSVDLSAGNIRGNDGEVLLRTTGQAYDREDFLDITVIGDNSGKQLRLG